MKKVLFTATVDSHILHFHIPYLKMFKDKGYEVHVATNGEEKIPYCDVKHIISFERSPIKTNNLKAIKDLKKIIKKEKFDIIHCHTPMGSVVTRLAAKRARKKGTRVIYTAHGFHFYKGASIFNWLIFYPIEKYLSKYTDCLITINQEDYELAMNKFYTKQIELVYGVGVDEEVFNNKIKEDEKQNIRRNLGLKDNDFVLIQVGELNKNKNQSMSIEIMKELVEEHSNIHLLLIGTGELEKQYKQKIKEYKLSNNVHMLGYRQDVSELMKISDVLISLSYREGLPVNVIEGLMSGLPVIVTDCRGNRDLIENNKNGYIIKNKEMLKKSIKTLLLENKLEETDTKRYEKKQIEFCMKEIYENITKIKVVHLLASDRFSGAENVAITIINKMIERNINSIYVSKDGPIRERLKKEDILFEPIHKLSIKEVKRICNKYKPDIIHAHDFTASVIVALTKVKCKKISHLHHNADWIKKLNIKSLAYLISSIRFNKIILVSESILNEYVFSKLIESKAKILGNPIDCTNIHIKSKKNITDKDKFDVIFVGRLEEEKNPIRFIEIVKEVTQRSKIKVGMVGDGKLRDYCNSKIKEFNLTECIKLYGFVDNPYPIIKNSKILCMTSRWEGFGLVAVEALALGVPVVVTNVGGLLEIVDNNCGKICDKNIEFVEEICKLINNTEYYNEKSKKAISKANKLENINEYIQDILKIYVSRKEE